MPKLLVSVFNPEEVRAAVLGGADIVDCEDPRAEVGMFEPRVITDVAYAVRQFDDGKCIPTSANIGFDLELFERGRADVFARRSLNEITAKAAQSALGLATAMDVGDKRSNIIKFGADGMRAHEVSTLVAAIKRAIRESRLYQSYRVVAAFLVCDDSEWERRKSNPSVVSSLLKSGHFIFSGNGAIRLKDYLSPEELVAISPSDPEARAELLEPIKPSEAGFPDDLEQRTKMYVDLIASAGADAVMIDTPVQAKAANICLLKSDSLADEHGGTLSRFGVYPINLIKKFSDYCAYQGLEAWVAGSINSDDAKRLVGANVDTVVCRGAASDVIVNPYGNQTGTDRTSRRISSAKVAMLAAAVHGSI